MRQLKSGAIAWGHLLATSPPDANGMMYVRWLRRAPSGSPSGSDVMARLQQAVRDGPGLRGLCLQDTSHRTCGAQSFSLALWSLIKTGRTWYERQGFVAVGATPRVRKLIQDRNAALAAFCSFPVAAIRDAIEAQLRAAQSNPTFPIHPASPFVWRDLPVNPRPAPSRAQVLWHRRKARGLLAGAPAGATMGTWLPSLTCEDFGAIIQALYGSSPTPMLSPAVMEVAGVRTPSLREFRRAVAIIALGYLVRWEWRP
jgi:hypothetical protein